MNYALPRLEQPTHGGFFTNASGINVTDSVLTDIHGDFHLHAEKTALDDFKKYISATAMHDSLARHPPPLCHPRTREKVLRMITDWVDNADAPKRIMWLNGPAGAGKSAIAQTIADHYKDSHLAASFFFQRNNPDRGVANRLFLSLAWQLAFSISETRPYIESALKKEPLLHTKSIEVQFSRLIMDISESLLRDKPCLHPKKPLVIIDGVDECANEQRQKNFLTLIGNEISLRKISLRFLICSRPEPHIQETFDTSTMKTVACALVLDDSFAPMDDIRRYLEDEFFRIFTKRQISPLPSDGDIYRLVHKSSSQFVYASIVIKFVDDEDYNPREQLDIILKLRTVPSSSSFAQLDLLYHQILSQQPETRFLRDVFVLIIGLGRPTVAFVCRRPRISEEKLKRKPRRMHSLLHISDSHIETYHRSLYDFFRNKKRAGNYHTHSARVMLVRLPRNARKFMEYDVLPAVMKGGMVVVWGLLIPVGLALTPLLAVCTTGETNDCWACFCLTFQYPFVITYGLCSLT